jgi:hypothetical protein
MYFEGEANGTAEAKREYSQDKRPGCKQVLFGLAIGRERGLGNFTLRYAKRLIVFSP